MAATTMIVRLGVNGLPFRVGSGHLGERATRQRQKGVSHLGPICCWRQEPASRDATHNDHSCNNGETIQKSFFWRRHRPRSAPSVGEERWSDNGTSPHTPKMSLVTQPISRESAVPFPCYGLAVRHRRASHWLPAPLR